MSLDIPVSNINKVGSVISNRLKKIGIQTLRDLVFYYPFRYQDFSSLTSIAEAEMSVAVTIKAEVESIKSRRGWKKIRSITEGVFTDGQDSLKVIWFNQPFIAKVLKSGDAVYLSGKITSDKYGVQMVNPVYEKENKIGGNIHTGRIVPLYSLTEGLTQKQIRWLIKVALEKSGGLKDFLPEAIKNKNDFYSLNQALSEIHFPKSYDTLEKAIDRLKFDEMFLFLLQSRLLKRDLQQHKALPIKFYKEETKKFVDSLPFELTEDQKKVSWQILKDLQSDQSMNRLLEGEVGSGKTVVAAIAMINTALNQRQSVIMAPTEILSTQHYNGFLDLFGEAIGNINMALLTRSNQKINGRDSNKATILRKVKSGKIDLVVGTHSIIQSSVEFEDLALAIIDEQHRFGVDQRRVLYEKGKKQNISPHFLSMTATPIPRSLALTLYSDLDLSTIKQLPKERKKIITNILGKKDRERNYEFIRKEITKGRQAFVICPLIDPSDKLGVKSVTEEYEKLNREVFSDFEISILHGKMKPDQKEKVMSQFLENKSKILVATSVVEVGVNIPNATVMLIEGAERFGLAQLHQFRGRVGRGKYQSYCFLATDNSNPKTVGRLQALVEAKDAFELAELDLKLRGPGDLFGINQSGIPTFKVASLFDNKLLRLASSEVENVLNQEGGLKKHPNLKNRLDELNKVVHLE